MMFDPNAPMQDFQSQQATLQQQQQLAAMLRKRADQAQQPQGQMVGGQYIPPHFLQQLLPMFQQAQAGYAQSQADDQERQFSRGANSAAQSWQSQLPQAIAAQPEQFGPPEEGGSPELAAQSAQMPDRGSILKATLAGMQIPGNEKAALLWNKGMGEDLAREDAQTERRGNLTQTLLAQKQIAAEKATERAEDSKRRSEDTRLSIEQRREAAAEAAAARRYAAELAQQVGLARAEAAGTKPAKPLPSTQANAWIANGSAVKNLDLALNLVAKNPKAFGGQNYLGDEIQQRLDPKGVDARAKVADISSLKIHDRSGAAVTVGEQPRLKPFIPNSTDTPDTIRKKLTQLKEQIAINNREIADYAESMGYKVPQSDFVDPSVKTPPGLVLPPGAKYVGPAP